MKLSEFLAHTGIQPLEFGSRIGLKQPNSVYRYLRGERRPHGELLQAIIRESAGQVTANDFYDVPLPQDVSSTDEAAA